MTGDIIQRIQDYSRLAYTVDVALPDGLESSYHKVLPFVQNMDGEAEIITEDMRLIEHFVQPIRSLFVNR